MAKKLKKKLQDICGLTNLSGEDRLNRAQDILASNEWKQQLCNDLIGLSFRELEHFLNGVVSERQFKTEEKVYKNEKLASYGSSKDLPRRETSGPFRTLAQILIQVYGPRANAGEKVAWTHSRRDQSSEDVFSVDLDDNSESD